MRFRLCVSCGLLWKKGHVRLTLSLNCFKGGHQGVDETYHRTPLVTRHQSSTSQGGRRGSHSRRIIHLCGCYRVSSSRFKLTGHIFPYRTHIHTHLQEHKKHCSTESRVPRYIKPNVSLPLRFLSATLPRNQHL